VGQIAKFVRKKTNALVHRALVRLSDDPISCVRILSKCISDRVIETSIESSEFTISDSAHSCSIANSVTA
jgi:hypothetical protein